MVGNIKLSQSNEFVIQIQIKLIFFKKKLVVLKLYIKVPPLSLAKTSRKFRALL